MKCQYCNNVFVSEKSLDAHKKKAKYCLKKQQELKIIKEFNCEYCNMIYFTDLELENHKNICTLFLKQRINSLEEENKMSEENVTYFQNENNNKEKEIKTLNENIKHLQEQIKQLQEQILSITKVAVMKNTTNNTNNTTNNINNKILNMSSFNFNDTDVQNLFENKYSIDIISEGQKGVAKFAVNNMLKDSNGNLNYLCTDLSRKMFKYKNESGEIEKDINAQKLTNLLTDNGISNITTKMVQEYWTNEDGTINNEKLLSIITRSCEIQSMKDDNTIFKNELASMTCL
jgi:hypothetical protein